jgi:hypothetical protein
VARISSAISIRPPRWDCSSLISYAYISYYCGGDRGYGHEAHAPSPPPAVPPISAKFL